MASFWFLLSIIFLLNTYFVAGKNIEITRCSGEFHCEPFPAVNISLIREVEEQDEIPGHVEINEDIVDLGCRYLIYHSTCIEDSGLTTTCPTFVKFYKVYKKLVGAVCTEYDKDILAILTCWNQDDIIQLGYGICMNTVIQLAEQEGYEDDTCRMIDAVQLCNYHFAKCSPKSVSRLETFFKEYKLDYCYMFDFIKENNLR